MFIRNRHPDFRKPLLNDDVHNFGMSAAFDVEQFFTDRQEYRATPLHSLPGLASELGLCAIYLKDEGSRLGLGSFKALGGAYAVIRLILEQASRRLLRQVDISELQTPEIRSIAAEITMVCATDGNHGRSVAQGAHLAGAHAVVLVHAGVSIERIAAISHFGAQVIRVDGSYDDSVAEALRLSDAHDWILVADTSWPGYEHIPRIVMQGYTVMVTEALKQFPQMPTHVFIQAGVGGVAAAVAAHLSIVLGKQRPIFIVVEPSRAACVFESAKAGSPVKIARSNPTIMAMLECYEPSLVAWGILSRLADGFMTIEDEDAVTVMNRLARPVRNDPAIVAGESGGAGLAGLIRACTSVDICKALGLDHASRIFIINTEGATDPERYIELVGLRPEEVHCSGAERQQLKGSWT